MCESLRCVVISWLMWFSECPAVFLAYFSCWDLCSDGKQLSVATLVRKLFLRYENAWKTQTTADKANTIQHWSTRRLNWLGPRHWTANCGCASLRGGSKRADVADLTHRDTSSRIWGHSFFFPQIGYHEIIMVYHFHTFSALSFLILWHILPLCNHFSSKL